MENKSNITLGEELQKKFLSGISQLSKLVRQSYGPKGTNVSVEQELYPYHIIANDMQSFIQNIQFDDPIERRALNFIKELSDKASKSSGEGRKTTLIIAEEILKGGFKENVKGMSLKEELDNLLPTVLDDIEKQKKDITIENIGLVAKTSSRSKEIGDWIQKIYQEIGKDGIIQVESSDLSETFYKVTDGVKFNAGWLTPYMCYGSKENAIYEKPLIIVTKKKIEKTADIDKILDGVIRINRPLVIFTDDMDNNVASDLIKTHRAGVAKVLIIRCPTLFKNYIFEDFSKCVGATIVEDASGVTFKNFKDEYFGSCEKLTTDGEETILQGIQDLTDHKEILRKNGSADSLRRLEWLNTKSAILKIGADSESDLSYKLLKAKDAVSACRLALADGIVVGGAKSLFEVGDNLLNKDTTDAERILAKALREPHIQLLVNEIKPLVDGKYQELDTKDVWDSVVVIKNAVRNAIGLAGIVLTTGGDVRFPDKSFEDKQLEILYKQRNPF